MFDEVLANLNYSKDQFENDVRDSFGASIVESCYDPLLMDFQAAKQMDETSQAEEAFIKSSLSKLRLII
jgi:hypothetical protein